MMESEEEASQRLELAKWYLSRADGAFRRGDPVGCVRDAQFCVENSVKSVIACFRLPSPIHDPSAELLDVIEEYGSEFKEELIDGLKKAGKSAKNLAPAHSGRRESLPGRFTTRIRREMRSSLHVRLTKSVRSLSRNGFEEFSSRSFDFCKALLRQSVVLKKKKELSSS